MPRTKPGKRNQKIAAGERFKSAVAKEVDTHKRIDKLSGPARGAADGRKRETDRTASEISGLQIGLDFNSGRGKIPNTISSINKSGKNPTLADIRDQMRKDYKAKNGQPTSGKPRDRRAAAIKAAQTRKMRGTSGRK